MCAIVLGSAHYQCNPDNISTPIAASLGDSITLGILSIVGSILFHISGKILGSVLYPKVTAIVSSEILPRILSYGAFAFHSQRLP